MRIICLLVIICLCLANAKYLPNESVSRNVLPQVSSSDEASNTSSDSSSNDSVDTSSNINNEDIEEDFSNNTELNILHQKWILKEQELTRHREAEKRKYEEKIAEELRKQEEKRVKEELKRLEKLEKEERKRMERLEKQKQKEEEIERKKQEKLKKEERKRQQKIINLLEKLEEDSSDSEESSQSAETNQFLALFDIEKTYISEKYGFSDSSSESEKKTALDRFLREEIGINANSTKNERREAIVNFIHNKILKETETPADFKNYVVKHVSADDIQHIEENLEMKINNLDNENALLNDTLPWVTDAQKNVQEKRKYLQALQSLSKLISKWLSEESQSTSDPVSDNAIPTVTETGSTNVVSTDSGSTTNTANTHLTTIDEPSSSKVPSHGTEEAVDNSSIPSSGSNTEISSSSDHILVTSNPLNPSEGTQSATTTTIASTSENSVNADGTGKINETNNPTVSFNVDSSTDLIVTESSLTNKMPGAVDNVTPQASTETHTPFINPDDSATVSTDVSSTNGISTPESVGSEPNGSGTEGIVSVVSMTESATTEKLNTNLHVVDELATTTSNSDILGSSTSKPILSTEQQQQPTTQGSVTETVVTTSPDVSTISVEHDTTTVNYSDSSSTVTTVTQQSQSNLNSENGTEATKIDTTNTVAVNNADSATTTVAVNNADSAATTVAVNNADTVATTVAVNNADTAATTVAVNNADSATTTVAVNNADTAATTVAVNNADSANTGSEVPLTEVVSTTENSESKQVPTEVITAETVTVYTERTDPRAVVVPGEPGV